MRKLFPVALLLASCTLPQARAQNARQPHKTPQPVPAARPATTALSPALVKNFCLNYSGAFYNLPQDYRLEAYYRFKGADLNIEEPEIDFTQALSNSPTLREVAYKSLYDYCADLQLGYRQSIPEILYILLYNDLHLSVSDATLLTQYCEQHYHREPTAPPTPRTFTQYLTAKTASPHSALGAATAQPTGGAIYSQVEQMPSVPGEEGQGVTTINKAVQREFRYPADDLHKQVEGQATASFVVNEDGTVTDAKIIQGLTPTVDAELLRAIHALPRLQPGRQQGQPVKVALIMPLTLSLK